MSFDDVLDLTTDDLFFFIILYYNVTPYIVRAIDVPYAACKVEFGEIPDLTAEEKGLGGVTVYIITIQSLMNDVSYKRTTYYPTHVLHKAILKFVNSLVDH